MKNLINFFVIFQLDHYQLLGLAYDAKSDEIEEGYRIATCKLRASKNRKIFGFLLGLTESSLFNARNELIDPMMKASYDKHLDFLRVLFHQHPQI